MQKSSSTALCAASDEAQSRAHPVDSSPHVAWQTTPLIQRVVSYIPDNIQAERLLRTVLLHLHRFDLDQVKDPGVIEREVARVAEKARAQLDDVPEQFKTGTSVDLRETELRPVDPLTAEVVHRACHYLGSFRGDGVHLGLYSDIDVSQRAKLVSLVTLSNLDLPHVIPALPSGVKREQVLVLSRLYSFPWGPRNTVSYTLGRVFSWIRKHKPDVKMLLTYLDPNLGFQGTVYRATNWVLFGRERKSRYLYLDGNYVTDRRMISEYGTADLLKLGPLLGSRIASSQQPLRPLELYAYFLDSQDRNKHNPILVHEFTPPSELVGA